MLTVFGHCLINKEGKTLTPGDKVHIPGVLSSGDLVGTLLEGGYPPVDKDHLGYIRVAFGTFEIDIYPEVANLKWKAS